jgi:quinol monooxygenase YgiN
MSITYICQSQAKPDTIEELRHLLSSVVVPAVNSSSGCESCRFYQSEDDPARFIGIEIWTSVEAHRAAIKNIPVNAIAEFMKLVVAASSGSYHRNL